jgi:hypothetical protein
MARSMLEVLEEKNKAKMLFRVNLPSSRNERGKLATRKSELQQLRDIERKALSSRKRYRERPYLAAVYQLYREWRQDDRSKLRAEKMAALDGKSLRSDAHPISVMLACSSPGTDEKLRSKWSLALQFARKNGVWPSDLGNFMDAHGGMAGCVRKFALLHKASKRNALKKKQKKIVLKKKAGLKPSKQAISSKTASRQKEKLRTEPGDRSSW